MPLAASEQHFRLADEPGSLGLNCQSTGVSLAGVPLLRKTARGFAPRASDEIGALMKCAYGQETDAIRLTRGLDVVAEALNRGDLGRAMIASVHLRLPELSFDGAARIARAEGLLAKYDPSEPRDERGRWTTGGGTGADASSSPNGRRTPIPTGPVGQRRDFPWSSPLTSLNAKPNQQDTGDSRPSRSWGAPVHLYGGQVTPVGGEPGSNGPPEEQIPIPPPEPNYNSSRVPEGFDGPGHIAGGLEYLPARHPTLPNGEPWPVATHDVIKATLAPQGRKIPYMVIFVPVDGKGDILVGSNLKEDYERPEGYDEVMLRGTPQVTKSRGIETPHARDSIEEGLALAETNQFLTIFFNRSFTTLTNGELRSRIQPDVVGIVRPELNTEEIYHPYEVLSPGQKLLPRQRQMPVDPRVRRLRGQGYSELEYTRSPYFEYADG